LGQAAKGTVLTVDGVKAALKAADSSVEWTLLRESGPARFEALGNAYVRARALTTTLPCVLLNTALLKGVAAGDDSLEMALRTAMQENTMPLQRAVYYGELKDSDDVLKHVLATQPGVIARVSAWTTTRARPVSLTPAALAIAAHLHYYSLPAANAAPAAAASANAAKHVTLWLAADFNTAAGQRAAFEVLRRQLKTSVSRVALLHNGHPTTANSADPSVPALLVALAMETTQQQTPETTELGGGLAAAGDFLARVLSGDTPTAALAFLPARQLAAVLALAQSEAVADILRAQGQLALHNLALPAQATALVVNMQIIGPFPAAEPIEGGSLCLRVCT
jgi:hypothetical protein